MTNAYCLSGLIEKRAELAGEIKVMEERIGQLRASLVHVDAVIHLLDPTAAPEEIRPKRIVTRNEWFGKGELPRLVMDVLRMAEEPMPTREVAKAVMERRELASENKPTFLLVEKRVDRWLRRQEGRIVERVVYGPRSVGRRIAG